MKFGLGLAKAATLVMLLVACWLSQPAHAGEEGSLVKEALRVRAQGNSKPSKEALSVDTSAMDRDSAEDGEEVENGGSEDTGTEEPKQSRKVGKPDGEAKKSASLQRPWWRSGDWEGGLQYRYGDEHDLLAVPQTSSFSRDLSLHLGYTAKPQEDWELHLALNSGRDHRPLSSYIGADKLDSAHWLFLNEYWSSHDWRDEEGNGLEARIGRFANPFDNTQVIYDNDLRLPSAYIQYTKEFKFEDKCILVGGNDDDEAGRVASHRPGLERFRASLYGAEILSGNLPEGLAGVVEDGPTRLGIAQLEWRFALAEDARMDAALAYHELFNPNSLGYRVAVGDWRAGGAAGKGQITNYSAVTGALGSEFKLAALDLSTQWRGESDWPLELELKAVKNLGAKGDGAKEDSALFASVSAGQREPGDWQFELSHARIEADAVMAALNRGEYGTNARNTRLQARYLPNAKLFEGQLELRAAYTWSSALDAAGPLGAHRAELLQVYAAVDW